MTTIRPDIRSKAPASPSIPCGNSSPHRPRRLLAVVASACLLGLGKAPALADAPAPWDKDEACSSRFCAAEEPASTPDGSPAGGGGAPRANIPAPDAQRSPTGAAATTPGESRHYALPLLGAYRKSMLIEEEVRKACEKYGVPLALARAVCMYESGADPGLTSGAGARGFFQVMPSTFRLMKVPTNIEAGVKYLSLLVSEFGREDDALAAYNGGPGRVSKGKPMPIESLQYVVGVGIYRTLLTHEETEIRAAASRLSLYTVVDGDSWEKVAQTTHVSPLELRLYNAHLATRKLKPGETVAYPPAPEPDLLTPAPEGVGPGSNYVTRRGDNYLLLALAMGADLDAFRHDNALWRIQPPFEGMRLLVNPRDSAAVPEAALASAGIQGGEPPPQDAAPAVSIVHKVRRGETLANIASEYGVSADAILKANKLRRSRIKPGQILKIPAA